MRCSDPPPLPLSKLEKDVSKTRDAIGVDEEYFFQSLLSQDKHEHKLLRSKLMLVGV